MVELAILIFFLLLFLWRKLTKHYQKMDMAAEFVICLDDKWTKHYFFSCWLPLRLNFTP